MDKRIDDYINSILKQKQHQNTSLASGILIHKVF